MASNSEAASSGLQLGVPYQGYSLDTGLERAAVLFRQKYGTAPAQVEATAGGILAGPIEATARQALAAWLALARLFGWYAE